MRVISDRIDPYLGVVPRQPSAEGPQDALPTRLLLTVAEAAEQLNLSRTLMWRIIARGHVPVVKIGRLTRIRPEALRAFVERLTEAS